MNVNPSSPAYTVAMPWYERDDFIQILALAEDRTEISVDYDVWRANALSVAEQYLAKGRALQTVTIRPGEFLAWITERQLPNTAATRLRYVEQMATAQLATARIQLSLNDAEPARHEPGELRLADV